MDRSQDDRIEISVARVLLNLAQSRISRLGDFYDEGERHFNIGIKDLEDRTAHLTQEEWDWGEGDLSIELRHELEELRELKRHFSIVGLFTAFEMFLRRTLRLLHRGDASMSKRIPKMRLDDMKKGFAKTGVDITKPDRDWKSVVGMKEVRNCSPGLQFVWTLNKEPIKVAKGGVHGREEVRIWGGGGSPEGERRLPRFIASGAAAPTIFGPEKG